MVNFGSLPPRSNLPMLVGCTSVSRARPAWLILPPPQFRPESRIPSRRTVGSLSSKTARPLCSVEGSIRAGRDSFEVERFAWVGRAHSATCRYRRTIESDLDFSHNGPSTVTDGSRAINVGTGEKDEYLVTPDAIDEVIGTKALP